jgi:glycosyltransferase involved in cell wall biosynthesis
LSKLLLLAPSPPWPSDAGARIRNAGLTEQLRADHDVEVLAFGDQVPLPHGRSSVRRAFDMARSDLPDMAQRLWSPTFAEAVRCRLRRADYAAVQAEGIEMARYLALVPPERRVYDAHNAEFLLQRRLVASASPVAGMYSRLQWRRLERFERAVIRDSRMTLAVSEHDANQLLALAGSGANVRVVPNAIDVAAHPFIDPESRSQPNLLFLGKLDFRPNAEALAWFIPEVLAALGSARLFAVGAEPPEWLVSKGQHDARIAATGYVVDERPYFARAGALVLPLRTGGGSRLKALVAMASGLPIVSTRVGIEGLEAEPGVHYLQAESATDWISALNQVLLNASLRQRLACNARKLVEQHYDWPAMRERLREAYAWLPA